jgi:hypothetical protein
VIVIVRVAEPYGWRQVFQGLMRQSVWSDSILMDTFGPQEFVRWRRPECHSTRIRREEVASFTAVDIAVDNFVD